MNSPLHMITGCSRIMLVATLSWCLHPELLRAVEQQEAPLSSPNSSEPTSSDYNLAPATAGDTSINPLLANELTKIKAQKKADLEALDVLATAMHHLSEHYVDNHATTMNQLVHAALRGMAYSLDPHTLFLSKDQYAKLQQSTEGKDASIGLKLTQQEGESFIRIISVLKDSPADLAGIQAQDKIIAIDDSPLKDLTPEDYPSLSRPRDAWVRLTIEKPDQSTATHRLRYAMVTIDDVLTKMLPPGIGYLRVAHFQEDTTHKVADFLQTHHQHLAALILDLRGNSGGLLTEAIALSDQFIESGLLLSVVGRNAENTERHFALKSSTYSDFPIIVLVDAYSASSSEIVAGALQDHERAIVMGQRTFGKGSVQILIPLPDGSGMKMTVARYYTPSGRSIQAEGIEPDLVLPTAEPQLAKTSTKQPLKEEDLKGHIPSKQLDGTLIDIPTVRGFDHYISQWEAADQQDYPLRMAYIYLKAWLKLAQNSSPRAAAMPTAAATLPAPAP